MKEKKKSCSKCKKKEEREEMLREVIKVERGVKIFLLIFLGFSLYGIYKLLSQLF